MTKMKMCLLAMILGTTVAWLPAASAAPQDCKQPSRLMQTVCADDKVARAFKRIDATLNVALGRLSKQGKALLRANQNDYLKFVETRCARPWVEKFAECVARWFQVRFEKTDPIVIELSGFRFLRLTRFQMLDVDPSKLEDPDLRNYEPTVKLQSTMVLIDTPRSAVTRRFNENILNLPKKFMEQSAEDPWPGEVIASVEIVSASPEIVAVFYSEWEYSAGSPHGDGSGRFISWSLPLGRQLKTTDIFKSTNDKRLAAFIGSRLPKRLGDPPDWYSANRAGVSRRGIRCDFRGYELGCYTCYDSVDLSWRQLRPWLNPKLPFDPRKLQAAPKQITNDYF